MAIKVTPTPTHKDLVHATEFWAIVGSLQYLTFTCPDITHVVNHVWKTSKHQLVLIFDMLNVFFGVSKGLHILEFFILLKALPLYIHFRTLIGLVVHTLVIEQLATLFIYVQTAFLGAQRNKLLLLIPVLKPNINP